MSSSLAKLLVALGVTAAALSIGGAAHADDRPPGPPPPPLVAPVPFSDADILDKPAPYFKFESVSLRYTHMDQTGTGFQSRAGPIRGPGLETLQVEQPQLEVVVKQGDKITHRLWVPVDIVTAASPDAIDAVSTASRRNEAASIDWTVTYAPTHEIAASLRNGVHEEENWRSWNTGLALTHSFAEDNTTLSASFNEVLDWFDKYAFSGTHEGHTSRASSNGNLGVTQLLSPTTIAHLDYGFTLQRGQLSNGWNTVPQTDGTRALERMPNSRVRHAFVARMAQFLPWDGALHAFYRLYTDDWGIHAHTTEVELYQRVSRISYLRLNYRFHTQSSASFFTTLAKPDGGIHTADSDLADFDAQTVGIKGVIEMPVSFAKTLRADLSVERYFRSNDLRVSVYSCGFGLLF